MYVGTDRARSPWTVARTFTTGQAAPLPFPDVFSATRRSGSFSSCFLGHCLFGLERQPTFHTRQWSSACAPSQAQCSVTPLGRVPRYTVTLVHTSAPPSPPMT